MTPGQEISALESHALGMLEKPAWPLVHLAFYLYLAGDYDGFRKMAPDLPVPMEVGETLYEEPDLVLLSHMEALQSLETLKGDRPCQVSTIHHPDGSQVKGTEAVVAWTKHQVLERELEVINSLLCSAQGCDLCCTGPDPGDEKEYFEIPLEGAEAKMFTQVPLVSSEETQVLSREDKDSLEIEGRPFYSKETAVYHWRDGFSLILPKEARCPNLDKNGRCTVYSNRPWVCRRPQIFCYVLDKGRQGLIMRDSLLAVLDCPYVNKYREEIESYARLCGTELIFRRNKV